jgi:hypothetical protein
MTAISTPDQLERRMTDASRPAPPSWNDGDTRQSRLRGGIRCSTLTAARRCIRQRRQLSCEKPNYSQMQFLLDELPTAFNEDPSVAERPEYRARIDNEQSELGVSAIATALVELCARFPLLSSIDGSGPFPTGDLRHCCAVRWQSASCARSSGDGSNDRGRVKPAGAESVGFESELAVAVARLDALSGCDE